MQNNPRSIFTGYSSSTDRGAPRPSSSDARRLSTPEYRQSLAAFSADLRDQPLRHPAARRPSVPAALPPAPPPHHYPPQWTWSLGERSHKSSLLSPSGSAAAPDSPEPPPASLGSKRPLEVHVPPVESPGQSSESLAKRRKLQASESYTINPSSLPGFPPNRDQQPPSPLFFSHREQLRPQLPARFSSWEAAARMLSKAKEETNIKTVTLARGTLSGRTPPGGNITRTSSERSAVSLAASPDEKDKNDALRVISSVGVVELLEHDARPSFIVDLGDGSNHGAGPLQPIFANSALRADSRLVIAITGKGESSPDITASHAFSKFKSWVLGSSAHGEAVEVTLSPVLHAGFTWSCNTLRRRLRVVSGSAQPSLAPQIDITGQKSGPAKAEAAVTSPRSAAAPQRNSGIQRSSHRSNASNGEPQDYFGSVPPPELEMSPPPLSDGNLGHAKTRVALSPSPAALSSPRSNLGPYDIPLLDSHPSLANECVLRAVSGNEVDWMLRSEASGKEVGFFDWTRIPLSPALPRHIQFARSVDWASTSLGPIEFWSADLRQMSNLVMASPHPAAMYWGDDLVALYNEAYIMLAGQKHPKLMGQRYREAWAEIWDEVKDVFAQAKTTGQATMKDDDCLFIKRSDYLEETYFSWSIIPIVGGDGTVMGLYNPAFEKTRRKIAERRMLTLREVGERTATARDVKGFWAQALTALSSNELDSPFVLLYFVSDESDSDSSSIHSSSMLGSKQCFLEGSLGVPRDHPAAPEQIDLKASMEGFAPVFREVMKTDKPILLELGKAEISADLLTGLDWRGFGDPCQAVVVCPIHPTTGESTLGFLVMGINPRRPYDDDYSLFIQLLTRQLATSLASVVLFEEEIRRGQRAAKLAALDRMELSEQLAARTQEAKENETRFTRMAEFSPVGLFIAGSEGHITYCNDAWYEISRVQKDGLSTNKWIDAVKEEDQSMVKSLWLDLVENTKPVTAEFRFKTPWEDRDGNRSDTWILFSAFPEVYEKGLLKSVFGSITNISQQKWAEGFQKRKMEEAVELKRQQENFIDITSHEMRNPLSAILQCADEISSSLSDHRSHLNSTSELEVVNNSIDAAQTIALCALHQKRIVDDVLTLSKIDSAMLRVTPVDAQPLQVVQRALKMFEGEVQTADIAMKFVVDDSYKKLDVDWVKIDPSRVLQVLINLTTNAIKFTTTEDKRTINVFVAASLEKPSSRDDALVKFFPMRSQQLDQTSGPDWGDGDIVYLLFAVQDTGRGLSEDEKKLLFLRFSQASPRTHVQYGGSGLGLFISRQLTELQGGEIGVASEAGKGSTFAFYIKARKTSAPKDPMESLPVAHSRVSSDPPAQKMESPIKTKDFVESTPKSPEKAPGPASRAEIRVLIVEDNLVNQRVLQKQLKHIGFSTLVANHGGEALDRLRESQFWHSPSSDRRNIAVVLMDQEMPVMDGLQCTRCIRQWEKEDKLVSHVPIIAVTANARMEQIQALLDAGMDDVVSKPFRIPDLVPKIEELAAKFPSE